MLLALLSGGGAGADAERVGGLPVVRKALLALSALLRTDTDGEPSSDADGGGGGGGTRTLAAAAAAATVGAASSDDATGGGGERPVVTGDAELLAFALPTLQPLACHADLKVRRRALFLLASLAAERATAAPLLAMRADEVLLVRLLDALRDDDEDVRTQSGRLLEKLVAAEPAAEAANVNVAARLAAAGGGAACGRALERAAAAEAGSTDPEEEGRLKRLAARIAAGVAAA